MAPYPSPSWASPASKLLDLVGDKLPQSVRHKLPPSVPRVTYSSLAGRSRTNNIFPRPVRHKLSPSVPRATYSSPAGTSHATRQFPQINPAQITPSVPRVTYSRLAGTSHTTHNFPRSVRHKLPPSVPTVTCSSLAGTSRTTRQPPQISPVQVTHLCAQGNLLKPSRDISHMEGLLLDSERHATSQFDDTKATCVLNIFIAERVSEHQKGGSGWAKP